MPLPRLARASVVVASLALGLVGLLAGAVRLLPWLLDPAVPWQVAAPFARGLLAVAIEAALLVGWPVGWALASLRFIESGEARVLATLGESPAMTVRRLAPQGLAFAAALAVGSLVYGSDASAPGRVASELVAQARARCAAVTEPSTYAIPFTGLTWLCLPSRAPRLAGSGPGAMARALVTARDAQVAGDFRAIDLDGVEILLPAPQAGPDGDLRVRVSHLSLRGMAPWASASTLPPPLRALVLSLAAAVAAALSALALLRAPHAGAAGRGRLGALALGASGPLAALAALRLLERAGARPALFLAAVPAAALGVAAVSGLAVALGRLRWPRATASQ